MLKCCIFLSFFLPFGATAPPPHPQGARASSFPTFLDPQTQWHTTVGRPSLDEWSARRLDLDLHNTQHSTNIHAPCGIRTHDLSMQAAADPRLRQRDHWDRICCICFLILFHVFIAGTWGLATNGRFALQMDTAVLDSFLLVRIKQERHYNAAHISFR